MDIKIVDFEPEHFDRMTLRPEDAADLAGVDRDMLVQGWKGGRTALYCGEPAFLYGGSAANGCGYLWAVASPLTGKLPLLVVRLGRAMVHGLLESGCHRVEAYCHTHNVRSLNWLTRSLGFRVEGVMRKSGPNAQDRFLLSVIAGE